jgi:hypothetical protein
MIKKMKMNLSLIENSKNLKKKGMLKSHHAFLNAN